MNLNWKRPLLYALLPILVFLAFVGFPPPFAAVERQVRERFPMIKRLFIEAGAAPGQQRWSRPDSTQAPSAAP